MAQPNIVRRDKASSHPRQQGRFYNGIVTSVRADGQITVKIPLLNVSYGPVMPLNTTNTSRYSKDDIVLCGFTDENNSQIVVFGSLSTKYDVFTPTDYGISRYASTAARDADITSPSEGHVIYLLDSDELQIYNGTEWITVIDTGNSENITASTITATSASIGTLTVTGPSTLNVLGSTNLTASTTIGLVSPTELGYLNGVTSAIQTQINTKAPISNPTFTGTATIPTLSVSGNATVTGNLTVNGTTTTVNSTTTTVDDPIITLGGDTAPISNDNKDRGIEFRYHSGTAASVGFFGYDDSAGSFTFLTGATNSSEVFSGTRGTLETGATTVRAVAAQDGIVISGRAGGTSSYAITMTPATLTANRTITFPNVTGTVVTTGDTGSVINSMLANSTISGVSLGSNLGTLTLSTSGTGITGSTTYNGSGAVTFTVTSDATSANTVSTLVARDASGNFSAGTITAGALSSSGLISTSGHIRAGSTGLTYAGAVSATNWFRSTGVSGWYNETYTGGIYMEDTTWVRVYNGKNFYCPAELRSNRYSGDGTANYGSYGSISITGTKGGYAGMDNNDTASTFMWTNNICGHYYNNNSWNWYFDRGTLRLLGSSDFLLSYVDNNAGLPWCRGPYLQGSNGWAFFNNTTGAWEMGQRYAPGGQNYGWYRGGLIIGKTPDDAFAMKGTLSVNGDISATSLPSASSLDATWQDVGSAWKLSYQPWSSRKVKTDIGPIGEGLNTDKLLSLQVVQFKYVDGHVSETDPLHDQLICGLIAEDVAQIYPVVIRRDRETKEPQSINYQLLIPPIIDLVQKLSSRIDSLEERIYRLETA